MSVANRFHMFLTVCPFLLAAVSVVHAQYSGGTGTTDDPYQIATASELIVLGETTDDYDKHFILTADIDLDPNLPGRKVFNRAVIAPDTDSTLNEYGDDLYDSSAFDGVFDGNGRTISHLTIEGGRYLGLFGKLSSGARISNLGLDAVDVEGKGNCVGGLVAWNEGSIANSYSTGAVSGHCDVGGLAGYNGGSTMSCYSTGSVSGDQCVGGLVGTNDGSVTSSYSTGSVTGDGSVGGLVGNNNYRGTITSCDSTSLVSGEGSIGGLAGFNGGGIAASYGTGSVNGNEYVGGLVGFSVGSIASSYCTGNVSGIGDHVGGLVGRAFDSWFLGMDSITSCVWDMETSGLTVSSGGVGLTTAEMMDPYMLGLNGFANDPNWVLDAGLEYPRLAWEGTVGQIIPTEPVIDWLDGQGTKEDPYRIDTAEQLILLSRASVLWDRHFVLGADIDLDPNLPDGRVFSQAVFQSFSGVFDGNGHMILHLTITGVDYVGLFGKLNAGATVSNLGLEAVDVNGTGSCVGALVGSTGDFWHSGDTIVANCNSAGLVCGQEYVGGLVGLHFHGSITSCHSAGSVTGDWGLGGLVGYSSSGITASYSTGSVSGDKSVGGLVGYSDSSITASYSTGTVSGGEWSIGGLVGSSSGSITTSYSTGSVTGNESVGGLVGFNEGSITASHSTGNVSGFRNDAGGLAGRNSGTITSSYSTGSVSADQCVGGLVGFITPDGSITASYSTGSASGGRFVGGLVGYSYSSITASYSSGAVAGDYEIGGLVGGNLRGTISTCYSTGLVSGNDRVGGLVGDNGRQGTIIGSFWDTETSAQTTSSGGGTGKTTAEMQTATTFLNARWDFANETENGTEDIWWILEGQDYPRLWWELEESNA